ncbi:UNVERIFIED_CONTAM: hypothetical protein FKN15_009370 [Acipenser sinensis]
MGIMRSFVNERIAGEGSSLARYNERSSTTSREIQTAVRVLLPRELAKHAVSEGTKAVTKYTSSKQTRLRWRDYGRQINHFLFERPNDNTTPPSVRSDASSPCIGEIVQTIGNLFFLGAGHLMVPVIGCCRRFAIVSTTSLAALSHHCGHFQ